MPLALTDAALAQIAIAACRVPTDRRRAWLADIAARLERRVTPAPATADRTVADRMQRYRARQRAGRTVLEVEVDEARLAVELVDAGFLNADAADDRAKLGRALGKVVEALLVTGNGLKR